MQCPFVAVHMQRRAFVCARARARRVTGVCVNRARRLTRRARRYLLTCYVFVRRALPCTRYKREGGEGRGRREETAGREGGKGASRSCWRTLVLLASMNIFMSGEHGAGRAPTTSSHHPSFPLRHSPSVPPFSASPVLLTHPLYRRP